jgi:MinD superfamily P-loop ATPase
MMRSVAGGFLVHAELGVAQDSSGKLVARVREEAREIAKRESIDLVLVDGPPGIGCPVHAALTGVDLALLVTEPSVSGEHDLERALDLTDHFKIESGVLINKHDLDPERSRSIEKLCARRGVDIVARLPFDSEVPRALARGELPLVVPGMAEGLRAAWERLRSVP